MLHLQDQTEWQIEWQMALAWACLALASASVCSCSRRSDRSTWGGRTAQGSMVRRRSTVRFRKGAPRGLHVSPGSMFTFGSDIFGCQGMHGPDWPELILCAVLRGRVQGSWTGSGRAGLAAVLRGRGCWLPVGARKAEGCYGGAAAGRVRGLRRRRLVLGGS